MQILSQPNNPYLVDYNQNNQPEFREVCKLSRDYMGNLVQECNTVQVK